MVMNRVAVGSGNDGAGLRVELWVSFPVFVGPVVSIIICI